jgi:ethanolamine ammonia-lyase small subunit
MAENQQMEKMIIESVIKELAKKGILENEKKEGSLEKENDKSPMSYSCETPAEEDGYINLPDISEAWVPEPENPEALKAMKKMTPARIGLYRAGTRRKTNAWLRFLADHAVALDAVFLDVSDEVLEKSNVKRLQSSAKDKEEFLKNPEKGNKLSEEAVQQIQEYCQKNVQVQIIICDGLSSTAIETNIPNILPPVTEGLKQAGISVGSPVFIKNGRVRVMDHVGEILGPEVILEFIGERPGLGTVESMSAYICYKPNSNTVEAERTMISNIHKGGTPAVEAGAQIVELIKKVIENKASGIKLNEKMK